MTPTPTPTAPSGPERVLPDRADVPVIPEVAEQVAMAWEPWFNKSPDRMVGGLTTVLNALAARIDPDVHDWRDDREALVEGRLGWAARQTIRPDRNKRWQIIPSGAEDLAVTNVRAAQVAMTLAPLLDSRLTPDEAASILLGILLHEAGHAIGSEPYGEALRQASRRQPLTGRAEWIVKAHGFSNLLEDLRTEARLAETFPLYTPVVQRARWWLVSRRTNWPTRSAPEYRDEVFPFAVDHLLYPVWTPWVDDAPTRKERRWWTKWATEYRDTDPVIRVRALRAAIRHMNARPERPTFSPPGQNGSPSEDSEGAPGSDPGENDDQPGSADNTGPSGEGSGEASPDEGEGSEDQPIDDEGDEAGNPSPEQQPMAETERDGDDDGQAEEWDDAPDGGDEPPQGSGTGLEGEGAESEGDGDTGDSGDGGSAGRADYHDEADVDEDEDWEGNPYGAGFSDDTPIPVQPLPATALPVATHATDDLSPEEARQAAAIAKAVVVAQGTKVRFTLRWQVPDRQDFGLLPPGTPKVPHPHGDEMANYSVDRSEAQVEVQVVDGARVHLGGQWSTRWSTPPSVADRQGAVALRQAFRLYRERRDTPLPSLSGRGVDQRRVHRLGAQNGRVFLRSGGQSPDLLDVHLLIDRSGSMGGFGEASAKRLVLNLAEALRREQHIRLTVWSESSGSIGALRGLARSYEELKTITSATHAWLYRHWSSEEGIDVLPDRLDGYSASGGFHDASAIEAVVRCIEVVPHHKPVLMVLSDGKPIEPEAWVGEVVARARRKGVAVFGVGMAGGLTEAHVRMYGRPNLVPFTGSWTALGKGLMRVIARLVR